MFVNNGPNAIEHVDANCNCVSCEQLHKPDKIVKLPSYKFHHSASIATEIVEMKTSGTGATQTPENVISISVVLKAAEQMRVEKVRQARFKYPMLECY